MCPQCFGWIIFFWASSAIFAHIAHCVAHPRHASFVIVFALLTLRACVSKEEKGNAWLSSVVCRCSGAKHLRSPFRGEGLITALVVTVCGSKKDHPKCVGMYQDLSFPLPFLG